MALKATIENDLKAALLERHRFVVDTLRGLKAAILNEEIVQNKRDTGLDDDVIEKIIAKEVKKRHEAAELYAQNDRAESADNERKEAEILSKYLPAQLSEADIQTVIDGVVAKLGASGMADLGKVIGAVKAQVGTTADGATVAKLVKQALI